MVYINTQEGIYMSVKIQEIGMNSHSTEYCVNYSKNKHRCFVIPNDKKDEFATKYPKARDTYWKVSAFVNCLAAGFGGIALSSDKVLSKVSKKAPSALAKFGGALLGAFVMTSAFIAGEKMLLNVLDKKWLNRYNAKEILEENKV